MLQQSIWCVTVQLDSHVTLEKLDKLQYILPLPKVGKAFNGPLFGILDCGINFPVSALGRLDWSLLGRTRRVLDTSVLPFKLDSYKQK